MRLSATGYHTLTRLDPLALRRILSDGLPKILCSYYILNADKSQSYICYFNKFNDNNYA